MMQWIIKNIGTTLWAALIGLLVVVSGPFWSELRLALAQSVLGGLSQTALLSLAGTLLVACLLMATLLVAAYSKKWHARHYDLDPQWLGTFVHRSKGHRVCGICLGKGVLTPLVVDGAAGLACGACNVTYHKKGSGHE